MMSLPCVRAVIAASVFLLPALAGCGAVHQFENGVQTGYHQGFRTNFKTSFLRSCEGGYATKVPFCTCVESTVERGETDQQLMTLKPQDPKFAAALNSCAQKLRKAR